MSAQVTAAIIGALGALGAAVIGVLWTRKRESDSGPVSSSREARAKKQHRYDVFVSAPLAAFATDDAISADHERIVSLVALLEGQFGFNVYWAGRNIRKKADFEAADISAKSDVAAILDSKYFLLLYPDKLVSSVLFEAGIALRGCLTSIYFVHDRTHLPFLMAQASQAFANVRTYEGVIPDDLILLLHKHGKSFFDPLRGN
jgi:hypothetical protein